MNKLEKNNKINSLKRFKISNNLLEKDNISTDNSNSFINKLNKNIKKENKQKINKFINNNIIYNKTENDDESLDKNELKNYNININNFKNDIKINEKTSYKSKKLSQIIDNKKLINKNKKSFLQNKFISKKTIQN